MSDSRLLPLPASDFLDPFVGPISPRCWYIADGASPLYGFVAGGVFVWQQMRAPAWVGAWVLALGSGGRRVAVERRFAAAGLQLAVDQLQAFPGAACTRFGSGEEFETPAFSPPLPKKPLATENYLRIVGLLYLFYRFVHLHPAVWNASLAAVHFLRILSGLFRFSGPFHFQWEKLDAFLTGKVFTGRRFVARPACACFAAANFALVFSRTIPIQPFARLQNCWRSTFSLSLSASDSCEHGHERPGFFVPWLGAYLSAKGKNRIRLSRPRLPGGGEWWFFYRSFPRSSFRRPSPGKLKWPHWRNSCGRAGPVSILYILPLVLGRRPCARVGCSYRY